MSRLPKTVWPDPSAPKKDDDIFVKPLLKWAGGKAKIAPRLTSSMAPFGSRYVEPFLGSGAMVLHLRARGLLPSPAILADQNPRLVEFHRVVRDDPGALLEELAKFPRHDAWKESYKAIRASFNEGPSRGPVQAARLLWLNKACFNGLYRESRAGVFNVPAGSYPTLALPNEAHVWLVSNLLSDTDLRCGSFESTLISCGTGDVVYCDPPYLPSSEMETSFSSYDAGGFGLEEHRVLARHAALASERGARVFVSNHDTPLARSVYASFEVADSFPVQRSIGRTSSSRIKVSEVLFRRIP